jgi:carbamoylphosphate synthase large subunit
MTDPVTADHIYLRPLTPESIEQILQEHQEDPNLPPIDAVLPTMGGQTALNLAIECEKMGIWEQYGVRMIGVDTKAIETTENREEFKKLVLELGLDVAPSFIANSFLEGKEAAQKIGFPLVIRPSYTLGGTGGGFCMKEEEFDEALKRGLNASPTHEVLVEKAVLGWKEFELELLARPPRQRGHHLHRRKPRPDGHPHRRLHHRSAGHDAVGYRLSGHAQPGHQNHAGTWAILRAAATCSLPKILWMRNLSRLR